jgi:ubiquinone/menaquinone biosynthesis C-methylase UbiE
VASSPDPLAGRLVLDVGSGTGAVAEAAEALGAHVVATDRSVNMIAAQGGSWPASAADAVYLPFCPGAFDAALAGFVLNHLAPARVLGEMARVVRGGGLVLATTWAGGRRDPVKAAIDRVLTRWGWVPPRWYQAMRTEVLPVTGDPVRLASVAEASGLIEVTATARTEDLRVRDPATVVAYRLAMPQVAQWAAVLDEGARAGLHRDAVAAVSRHVDAWRPKVIFLTGRVAPQPSRRAARSSALA